MRKRSDIRCRASTWRLAWGVALTAWTMASAGAAAGTGNDLRLLAVRPEVFDYLLTAVSLGADHVPVLAFKDLAGTTRFVRPGGRLGDWTVATHQPRKEKVFNPSVNAQLDVDTSTATLRGTNGQERTLVVGVPLVQPGSMACFVSLTTGTWVYARRADTVALDGLQLTVISVSETVAQVQAAGQTFDVTLASDSERQAVMTVWRTRQEQAEAQSRVLAEARARRKAETAAAEARAAAAAPVVLAPQQPARFSYVTEYRYPTEYEVVPILARSPDGTQRTRAIIVPTQFGTRVLGTSHEVR